MNKDRLEAIYDGIRIQRQTFPSLPSTNTYLIERAKEGAEEGLVVLADSQSHGRGRLGRSFHSPVGSGLYMSVLLRPRFSADASLRITTAAAVAVAEAIEELTGRKPSIKWVNDILLDGKKVGGILTEGALTEDGAGLRYAVLGIGVNLTPPHNSFPKELEGIAGAIGDDASKELRDRLADVIMTRFFGYYATLETCPPIIPYRKRLAFLGMSVRVLRGGEEFIAVAEDIDSDFRLILRLPDGRLEALSCGEISIKLS